MFEMPPTLPSSREQAGVRTHPHSRMLRIDIGCAEWCRSCPLALRCVCCVSASPSPPPCPSSNSEPSVSGSSRWTTVVLLAVLAGVAAWLRLLCSRGELWLDEIWTWDISHKLTWPGGLFSQLREENNHYLNTLVIWLWRDCARESAGFWVRLPAVVCGVATVGIAWRLGRVGSAIQDHASLLAAGLTATSYLLVHYSSEARGYAYAVFFAALAFDQLEALERHRRQAPPPGSASRQRRLAEWLFPVACCGGFLSQPIFLTCFGAQAVWLYLRLKKEGPEEQVWPTLLRRFVPPGLCFVLLYVVDLRHAVNGGGDVYPLWRVVLETLSLAGGGPFSGWGAVVVAGLVAGAFVHGLRVLARAGDDRWVFYVLVVVVLPLGLLVVLRRAEVYPRYFLIAVFFLLQAVAVGLADLLRRGSVAWLFATVSVAVAMWGNGQHIGQLVEQGRGGYRPVLERLAQQEPSSRIELRSDHDFRHPLMFKYFLPLVDLQGKTFRHVNLEEVPVEGTPWLLTHSLEPDWQPPATRTVGGIEYELTLFRPYAGLSGWGLALYRRREPAAGRDTRKTLGVGDKSGSGH